MTPFRKPKRWQRWKRRKSYGAEREPVMSYRIYPSIGLARVGDSPDDYYLGAESPQLNFVPGGGYRDASGKVRRMGQRFRIYEYADDVPVREITAGEASIEWQVQLANSKAAKSFLNQGIPRQDLILDTGTHVVQGANQDVAVSGRINPPGGPIDVKMGNLLTDDSGRLVVLGGHGNSGTWDNSNPGSIQNSGWYDDTSDGPVTATVTLNDGGAIFDAKSAWVIVGCADFAHPMEAVVTVYDLAENAARQFTMPLNAQPSFTEDIYPVLLRAVFMQWTSSTARFGHAAGFGDFLAPAVFPLMHDKNAAGAAQARNDVFVRLRNPNGGGGNMPDLAGGLALTDLQYSQFEQWKDGNFDDDWDANWNPSAPPEPPLSGYAVEEQPDVLNQASLETAVGGSFAPGIEAGAIIEEDSTYEEPFRISRIISAGDLTQSLSVPWQADFNLCTQVWWPSARPGSVIVDQNGNLVPEEWKRGIADNRAMVNNWSRLGFVIRQSTSPVTYTEQERTL